MALRCPLSFQFSCPSFIELSSIRWFRSVVDKLGPERLAKVKIVGHKEAEKSLYGQLLSSKMLSSDSSEQLATEVLKAGIQIILPS